MSGSPASIVQRLLLASEDVKAAIYAQGRSSLESPNPSWDPYSVDDDQSIAKTDDSESSRIIAIVTHVDSSTGDEQGCVFILRPKRKRSASLPDIYLVEHVFPILESFVINMAQSRRHALNLSPSAELNQPRTEFTLTVHPGHNPLIEPISLNVNDVQNLRPLLAEYKRLKDLAVPNIEPGTYSPYPWILPYVTKSPPAISSPTPRDLRHTHRPLDTLLSEAFAGSSGDDVSDISTIREEWIRSQVERVHAAGQHSLTLKLHIGTFNVNGKLPSQDLSAWVRMTPKREGYIPKLRELSPLSLGDTGKAPPPDAEVLTPNSGHPGTASTEINPFPGVSRSSSATLLPEREDDHEEDPDMIVLGFQELDLSAGALLYSTETTKEEAWFNAAMAGLGEKGELYTKLASKQLVGMLLIIIVKRNIRDCCTQVQTTSIGAGIMGLMGNKGATALRLAFTPPSSTQVPSPRPVVLTFVNAHLAAFDEMYEKRNQDFHDISRRLVFDSGPPADHRNMPEEGYTSPNALINVYQSDVLFWIGDLNYRINLPDSDIRALLSENTQDSVRLLLEYDQLTLAQRTKSAFSHFAEAPITHLPSYRFNGTVLCDDLGYDLKRKPAWTDHILHMSSLTASVQQRSYAMHAEITMSDHRPVSATFDINIPAVDADELELLVHSLWRDVANFEDSQEIPKLKLATSTLDFGSIGYKQRQTRTLRVHNTGKVPSVFRFLPLTAGAAITPDWLRIEPQAGLLRPEEHVEIIFTAEVHDACARQLNLRDASLEATLILHTALGKDHFLTVTGQYARTCFATSLARLVRLPGPVRTLQGQQLLSEGDAASAPREIMRLVNWLMSEATTVNDLFFATGDSHMIAHIRECLDTGAEFPKPPKGEERILCLSVADCLLQLLSSLPEPVVPTSLHLSCTRVSSRDEAFELLNQLPSPSVNVWISVTSFLHFISQQGTPDKKAERLAAVFAPVFLRGGDRSALMSPLGKRSFVSFFIA